MAFYFVLTSITTALVLSVVLAFTWEGQFQSYARQNMQRLAEQTAENLALQYEAEGGWTVDVLSYATYASKSFPDVSVQVLDARGNLIYDDPVGEDGDGTQIGRVHV